MKKKVRTIHLYICNHLLIWDNKEAIKYANDIDKKNLANFESNLILGLNYFKRKNYSKAEIYFKKLTPEREHNLIFGLLKASLDNWLNIVMLKGNEKTVFSDTLPSNFKNFKLIQETFASCYFNKADTRKQFKKMINDDEYDFSRYHFFFINYLFNSNNDTEAIKAANESSKLFPRNLLINQLKNTLNNNEKNKNQFNCKNPDDILAEIIFVIANALSSTGNYKLSNFYTNISKYLNPNFSSFDGRIAENFLLLKKYNKSKVIYKKLEKTGSFYYWYSSKNIAGILVEEKKNQKALTFLTERYNNIKPNIYRTYDFANFLRNSEEYKKSIKLYSDILLKISDKHKLYAKILDKRGIAYERSDQWELAEKDLLNSLKMFPDEPYVMNYLAYSWVEKGKNINKALSMLRKANNLKKNDGYITDSLGWALYKLNNFSEAKIHLRQAIILMPSDPVVNDHFADCLWMNNEKIQARYYWNYVLNLESAEEKLKKQIKQKLLFGLEKI